MADIQNSTGFTPEKILALATALELADVVGDSCTVIPEEVDFRDWDDVSALALAVLCDFSGQTVDELNALWSSELDTPSFFHGIRAVEWLHMVIGYAQGSFVEDVLRELKGAEVPDESKHTFADILERVRGQWDR